VVVALNAMVVASKATIITSKAMSDGTIVHTVSFYFRSTKRLLSRNIYTTLSLSQVESPNPFGISKHPLFASQMGFHTYTECGKMWVSIYLGRFQPTSPPPTLPVSCHTIYKGIVYSFCLRFYPRESQCVSSFHATRSAWLFRGP